MSPPAKMHDGTKVVTFVRIAKLPTSITKKAVIALWLVKYCWINAI